jgi:hypothetical protein
MKDPTARDRLRNTPRQQILFASLCFGIGFFLTMALLAVLGARASSTNMFRDFGRFHTRLAPDSFFLVTAKEVRSLVATLADKSKINVIIGGSSVFYGVGQPAGQSLADNVRRELGDNYRVINLAMRAGDISGIAEQTVEMLLHEGYKIIYVADIGLGTPPNPIGGAPYQYFYWQAKARGYLFDWARRDSAIGESAWISEPAIGAMLNRWLNFDELWNYIGYRYGFTVFSSLIPYPYWQARMNLPDNEIDPPAIFLYRNVNLEFDIINRISQFPSTDGWKQFEEAVDAALPPQVRPLTVAAFCENSSWLFAQTSPQNLKNRVAIWAIMKGILTNFKLTPVSTCDGLAKNDYIDRTHLSIAGAAKASPKLAAAIRSLAAAKYGAN